MAWAKGLKEAVIYGGLIVDTWDKGI